MPIEDFTKWTFTDGDITHDVYTRGAGPIVVLMHELPGMTKQCIVFADELVERGFRVSMPLLFGEPGDDHSLLFTAELCISSEFKVLATGGGSPIVNWLRALCRRLKSEAGVKGVGVIGMCLTGNFAISLMADDAILAPVSSQPALPLALTHAERAAIGVPPAELAAAQARNQAGVPLMCLRFSNDRISPPERFAAIQQAFAANFLPHEIKSNPGNPDGISTKAHSVLTMDFCGAAGHPTRKARDAVIDFLTDRLAT